MRRLIGCLVCCAALGCGSDHPKEQSDPGSSVGGGDPQPTPNRPKVRTVAYLSIWRGSLAWWSTKLDFSKLSFVNLAFADVDSEGNVSVKDDGVKTLALAARAAGAQVCVAIGGAGTINNPVPFAYLVAPDRRAGFIQKLSDFMSANEVDCLDVDFEGNGVTDDYGGFIEALSAKLKPEGKLLSAAVAQWFGQRIPQNALGYFDFINVMSYDLCWAGGSSAPCDYASYEAAGAEMDYWVNSRQVPREKAVFGVPFYGYKWENGNVGTALTYAQIVQKYPEALEVDRIEQDGAVILHNSKLTIERKAKLAASYGGIMIWELGQDSTTPERSLMNAIHGAL